MHDFNTISYPYGGVLSGRPGVVYSDPVPGISSWSTTPPAHAPRTVRGSPGGRIPDDWPRVNLARRLMRMCREEWRRTRRAFEWVIEFELDPERDAGRALPIHIRDAATTLARAYVATQGLLR
jgi:hypothetical protein